jgi:DNA-binding MarR family transcriptional regulator
LQDILRGCNQRYLAHLSALDDFAAGARALDQVTRPRQVDGKTVKPINFFNRMEQRVLRALQCPASTIAGLRRADLMPQPTDVSPAALSRYIRRLRKLGLLKRIRGTYRYYLTKIGSAAVAARSHLTENVLIPALA